MKVCWILHQSQGVTWRYIVHKTSTEASALELLGENFKFICSGT